MEKPSLYERAHWAIFNAGAKLFGFLLPIWSVVFGILFVVDLFKGSHWYGFGWFATIIAVSVCILLAYIGIKILRAKPFRPSKYEDFYAQLKKQKSI